MKPIENNFECFKRTEEGHIDGSRLPSHLPRFILLPKISNCYVPITLNISAVHYESSTDLQMKNRLVLLRLHTLWQSKGQIMNKTLHIPLLLRSA